MGFKFWTLFVSVLVFFAAVQARPGQLNEQRYEFQQFQSNSYNEQHGASPPMSARLEEIPWSRQHPNEVNAFAEVFRQQYNQMVEHNNRMMQMHQQTMSNLFRPVTYELYHIPNAQTFSNFFGNQQQYVQNQAQQMTHQLVQNLQQGIVTQQDLMNPEFFVNQAASELDRVHQSHHTSDNSDMHSNNDHQEYEMQQQHSTFESHHDHNDEQQQYEPVFVEADQHTIARDQFLCTGDFSQTGPLKKILVYNSETNSYEYVYVNSVDQVAAQQSDNQHMHPTSYIQSLPPVQFNNERVTNLDHEVEAVEVHTPVSIEIPKSNRQLTQEQQKSTIQTTADEYYESTYDQQPIYDLRFLDSVSTTNTPPRHKVVSLERKRINTTLPQPSSTTTTMGKPETVVSTTESSVMSMLPHKKQSLNYTEVYHKVREELNKHMQKEAEMTNEETHFMGLTSNKEQTKLQYDTVSKETPAPEIGRGDQPSFGDDYVSEEQVESEPGIGYYPVDTEASPTTLIPSIVENNFRTSSEKPVSGNQSPHYQAPLAPFPTTTPKSNPYYTAPLAPFPNAVSKVSFDDQNLVNHQYAQFSEIENMNQETQPIAQDVPAFAVANVVQDRNEQHFFEEHHHAHQFEEQYAAQDYDDTQQFETFQQQTFVDLGHQGDNLQDRTLADSIQQSEHFTPTSKVAAQHAEEVPAHVMELTTAATTIPNEPKKGWFQKQWSKLKHTFQS